MGNHIAELVEESWIRRGDPSSSSRSCLPSGSRFGSSVYAAVLLSPVAFWSTRRITAPKDTPQTFRTVLSSSHAGVLRA